MFFSFMSRFQVFRNAGNSRSRAGNTLCSRSQALPCSSRSGKPGLEQWGCVTRLLPRSDLVPLKTRLKHRLGSNQRPLYTNRARRAASPPSPAAPPAFRPRFHPQPRYTALPPVPPGATLPALLPGRCGPRGRRRGRLGRLGRLQRRPLQLLQLLQRYRLEGQDLGLAQHHGGRVLHRQLPCKERKGP